MIDSDSSSVILSALDRRTHQTPSSAASVTMDNGAAGRAAADEIRTAYHEAGHALVARILRKRLGGATIDPEVATRIFKRFGGSTTDPFTVVVNGLVWWPGKPKASCRLEDTSQLSDTSLYEKVKFCLPMTAKEKTLVEKNYAAVHAHTVIVVAGTASEKLFLPEQAPMFALSDMQSANEQASMVCRGSFKVIDAFVDFAKLEAAEILAEHKTAVQAVADALIEKKTLNPKQIDACIAVAEAKDALEIEHARRAAWREMEKNAAAFEKTVEHFSREDKKLQQCAGSP
jgi:hypothetical protein